MFKVWGLHKNLCMVPGSSSPTSSWRWGRTWWCWWSWWWCWSWPGHDDHGNCNNDNDILRQRWTSATSSRDLHHFSEDVGIDAFAWTVDNGHDEKPENIGNMNEIHKSAMTCLSFYCNTQPSIRIKLCTQDTTVNELSWIKSANQFSARLAVWSSTGFQFITYIAGFIAGACLDFLTGND